MTMALFVLTSDCLPIVLYDPMTQSIGVIHAGWKWLFGNIISNTLQKMQNQFWIKAEHLQIYIGPSISQENYEVQIDFLEKIPDEYKNYIKKIEEKYFFDLQWVSILQFQISWIPAKNMEISSNSMRKENLPECIYILL